MPAWLLRINRALAAPFSPAAENMFALMGFVANFQPRWEAPSVVERFKLPKQMTVSDYLDANYRPSRSEREQQTMRHGQRLTASAESMEGGGK